MFTDTDADRVVVGPSATPPQDHMTVLVAPRPDERGLTLLVYTQEGMRAEGSMNCIYRNLEIAVRAVFEAHRHRKTACQFAVGLALGSACPDSRPAYEVGEVSRSHRVERFNGSRQAEFGAF